MTILIVGAAGNLGRHVARRLLEESNSLRLFVHQSSLPADLDGDARIQKFVGDLGEPASLTEACRGVHGIVYLAGVLFRPRPESFLHRTNTLYVQNLVDAALAAGVRKFVLVSFPHVEGESSPEAPARGKLDAHPTAVHARTRLAAEQYLFRACEGRSMNPLTLRAGVIYGREIKLIDAARRLMRIGILAVWRKPTWIHLLSLPDFLKAVELALQKENLSGVFNLCDDRPMLLQDFLDALADHWGFRKPFRLPNLFFHVAAGVCEELAAAFKTAAPIHRDMIKMGMTSVVADTSRMKTNILPTLFYPTFERGIELI